jgi:D-3-phosphoglycerate dehydrogenase
MARILVTEKLAQAGLDAMAAAGHEVIEELEWTPQTLLTLIKGAHALVVRSATKVTKELLEAGTDLMVVGRAGVGLDNVDIEAATQLGVMVVNAPESNILSAAEHAFALLLAQARNIPQAHSALVAGRWERSKWEGVELHGKTLGVVGLGRIGALVSQRAMAFGMHVIAYDPYTTQDRAKRMGVELLTLDELITRADFITIHLPKTKETAGLFNKELLAKTKKGVRIINAARGGLVVEQDLADAINSGHVAGAAFDVFDTEPSTDSPLFGISSVVVTPHLGASTGEAQDKAGEQIAEQIVLALNGDFVPYAVNVSAGAASEAVRPYLGIAERLGRFLAELCEGMPEVLDVEFEGELAGENTSILTLSVLKGVLGVVTEEPVSYVNAPRIADERGLKVRESQSATSTDRHTVITVRSPSHTVSGTLRGGNASQPSIVSIDGHTLDLSPAGCLLVVRNDDRLGMIGIVGTKLGAAGVSIVNMAVAQQSDVDGTALMAIATDGPSDDKTIASLREEAGILDVHQVRGV